jgi:hypothetical protein
MNRLTPEELKALDDLRCHITDFASIQDYLTMGYRLEESLPYWRLYTPDGALYASVDRAAAETVLLWGAARP